MLCSFFCIMVDTKEGDMVKLIHCADIHLGGRLNTHFNMEQAKERNAELIASLMRMVEYGQENGMSMILISGDLCDTSSVPVPLQKTFIHIIQSHPDMEFFYLRGNHDDNSVLDGTEETLSNLHCFNNDAWTTYTYALHGFNLTVSGMELSNHSNLSGLRLNSEDINIVMLHGQIKDYGKRDGYDIPLRQLEYQNIDYLALGHIHKYEQGVLKPCGKWCYSGSLEGRGFDETGEHGFVLVDVDEKQRTVNTTFVPFSKRRVHVIRVDVSDCTSSIEMVALAKSMITSDMKDDMVRIVLSGHVDIHTEKDIITIQKLLEDTCWYVEVKDETEFSFDYGEYAKDASLKGEFVRLVYQNENLDEMQKAEIIRCGIAALAMEDVL